ncbi:MAG: phosphate-selective porin [Myxococcaceae bacterium]|nr:phosphate-selective porin [Myxococcaceae bacterium]
MSSDGGFSSDEKPLFEVGKYRVRASGYVQAQYQLFEQSRDELSPDGLSLLNQTGFTVPRARILVEGSNDWSSVVLEYDVANINSSLSGVQRAEATLMWRDPRSTVPYLAGTLGVFRTPFGFEAARSARDRLFAENATITQAFFPGQSDTGARLEGGVEWFRYAVAFVNGHPINEPRFGGRIPTKQGDILGRLGLDANLGRVRLVGGASLLKGKGFSPGSPATKDSVVVRDVNESGTITPTSILLLPGRSAIASRTFDRWATGVDAELSAQVLDVWKLWVRGEFMFGSNIDRGQFISDPVSTGFNGRGYGAVAAVESLLWQTGLLGVRYDFYDPNPDATSNVAGAVVKASQRISTTSAVAGLQLPGTRTRFFAEYDRVKDHLALGLNGRPSDLKNDRFLCRLQVSLW